MFVLQTLETRWFFPGTIPPEVGVWYASLGDVQSAPPRTDLYLLGTGEALGFKLREGRIEAKKRTAQFGEMDFLPGVCGRVEGWVKWSFVAEDGLLPALLAAPDWAAVEKRRQILYYTLDNSGSVIFSPPGSLPETGGGLELTALRLNGADWWTVGVEVYGAEEILPDFLMKIVRFLNPDDSKIKLACSHSYSYPFWLQENR